MRSQWGRSNLARLMEFLTVSGKIWCGATCSSAGGPKEDLAWASGAEKQLVSGRGLLSSSFIINWLLQKIARNSSPSTNHTNQPINGNLGHRLEDAAAASDRDRSTRSPGGRSALARIAPQDFCDATLPPLVRRGTRGGSEPTWGHHGNFNQQRWWYIHQPMFILFSSWNFKNSTTLESGKGFLPLWTHCGCGISFSSDPFGYLVTLT